MDLIAGFDATQVEPAGSFEPLPAGKYVALIADSEHKTTKAGTGEYVELKLEVIDGEHKGRLVFDRLNLKNPNPQAVAIAKSTLSAICRAVNVHRPGSTPELHGKPLLVNVGVKKRSDNGELTNEVKGYGPVGQATAEPATAAASGMPWNK